MSWNYSNFSDVVKDITGGNVKFQSSEYLSSGKYPIIDQGEKEIGGYTNEKNIVNRKKDVVVFGDHTKCLKFIDYDFCLGADGVKVLEPINELDTKFLYFYLSTITLPNVGYSRHFKFLKEIQIPLPPLPIQKRIAEILDAADALRRNDQELLRKYDELAQAIFIDMFGDPVKNEKGWEVKKFGDYIDYIGDIGSNGSNEVVAKNLNMLDSEDFAIMIRTTNLAKNDFTSNVKYVSEKTYNFFKKSKIYGGEIIMNKIGSAGDFWIMPNLNKPVSLGLNQLVIRLKGLNTKFIYYYLSTDYGKSIIKSSLNGAVTKSITKSAVKALPILYPEIKLQEKFELLLSNIDAEKEKLNNSVINSNLLFNSLLQQAFKGELVK